MGTARPMTTAASILSIRGVSRTFAGRDGQATVALQATDLEVAPAQ